MVVDGSFEFTGSDLSKAQKAIGEARKLKKADIEASVSEGNIKLNITNIPEHKDASVYLAVTEDNLASEVRRGENSGKKLDHMSVVRELKTLGMLKPSENSFAIESAIPNLEKMKRENYKIVIFIQENVSRKILGAKKI
jgi:hypothetical protein